MYLFIKCWKLYIRVWNFTPEGKIVLIKAIQTVFVMTIIAKPHRKVCFIDQMYVGSLLSDVELCFTGQWPLINVRICPKSWNS